MHPRTTQAVCAAILRLLRPLVRLLLRNAIPFRTFAELAKRTFVTVAMEDFHLEGKKQTVSRVSTLTGLSRKEVRRVLRAPHPTDAEAIARYNRAARVITGWIRDPQFCNSHGRPRKLSWRKGGGMFGELVRRYSGDIPARAVLDELLRVGIVEREKDGRISLLTRGYVPSQSESDKLGIMGSDVADLITTIDHNLQHGSTEPWFQRKVMYDNLPSEAMDKFKPLVIREGQTLLERLDRWLSRHDRDANPSSRGSGRVRAGVGIYYFEEQLPNTSSGRDES
jgi:hypothetical protein